MQVTVSNTRINAAIPQRQLSRAAEALSTQGCILVSDSNGQQTELPREVSELISQVVRVMQEEDQRERFRGKNLDDVFDDLAAVGLC